MKSKSFWVLIITISAVFCLSNYTQAHLAEMFGGIGDYYFKKSDIQKAQEYYENAFDKGLMSTKQREIYVNSIINSPLTLEAQEKLVKFLAYSKTDSASLKADYFLYDLKREIHRKYPDNYITNAPYNQKILRWGNNPITYGYSNSIDVPKYFIKEIENAFTELENVTERQLLFIEDNKNPNIIIKFNAKNPADEEDYKYVVAYVTPVLELNKLKNMEMNFYLKDSRGKYFSQNQVYNTALHEIIHALGFMGHCEDRDSIMYLTKDSKSVGGDFREKLTFADINTIKLLYKIRPQITNVQDVKSEYIPFLVLGTDKEITNEKIEEAWNYIKNAPELPAGYIDLAEAYVAEKDYIKAVKNLEKALKYADTEEIKSMVYFNLAVTNFYLDNLEKSKKYLKKSIEIKDSAEKHYLLGEIYVKNGDIDNAIEEYKLLIKQNPQNIDYVVALTNIYVLNRDFVKARKVLKNYVKSNPNDKNNQRFVPYGILRLGL